LDGDEIAIVQLFEKAYANYGGYSKKTPECWRWCCIKRPDVERNGIIVALDNDSKEIAGYVVAGKSGYLWELAYNPQSDGESIVSLLLDKATTYIESAGASSVNFNAPQKDRVIKRVCQKRGFVASEPPKMFLSVLNLRELVSLLADNKASELLQKYDETILIKIEDAPFWVDAAIFVHINKVGIKVGNESQVPTIQLGTDYTTFSSILFGNQSPFSAFVHAKLKIKPLSKIYTMLKVLSALQVNTAWFYPLSDYG
jgi:hypothetical protein